MTTIDISAVTERYARLNSEYEAYVEKAGGELRDELRKTLGDILKIFFEANPNVASISWTQYTPYFADGDACEFEVGERRFTLCDPSSVFDNDEVPGQDDTAEEDDDGSEDDFEDDDEDEAGEYRDDSILLSNRAFYSKGGYKDPARVAQIDARLESVGGAEGFANIRKDFDIVSSFIGSIDEGHIEEMFGDHVQVCCTKDGIKVFKYDNHD